MGKILSGSEAVARLDKRTAVRASKLYEKDIYPMLAVLRSGCCKGKVQYKRMAMNNCTEVGVLVRSIILPDNVSQELLLQELYRLNADESVHGILIDFPFPVHMDGEIVRKVVNSKKDVDGITSDSLVALIANKNELFPPCIAQAVLEILDEYKIPYRNKRIVVLDDCPEIGVAVSTMLIHRDATVTLCHRKESCFDDMLREADIVVVCGANDERFANDDYEAITEAAASIAEIVILPQEEITVVAASVLTAHVVDAAEKITTNSMQACVSEQK